MRNIKRLIVVLLPKLQGKVGSLRDHEERYETHGAHRARFVPFLVVSQGSYLTL